MMSRRHLAIIVSGCLILVVILVVTLTSLNDHTPAHADTNASPSYDWHTCNPTEVATFTNRIHVHCSVGVGDIDFFAAPTNSEHVDRYLSIIMFAIERNTELFVAYDISDLSGSSFGCRNDDCRAIHGLIAPK